jgi:hypothetical protein
MKTIKVLSCIFLFLISLTANSQNVIPVNLVLGNKFCEKIKNSAQLMELASRVKLQVDQDGDGSHYSIDTGDRIIARLIIERHQYIKEKTPRPSGFPMKFIDNKLLQEFDKTIDQCLVSIHDSDLIYLFSGNQLRVNEIRKRVQIVLEERRPTTNRRIDSAGNVVAYSTSNNIQLNIHRSCDYSTAGCQTAENELNIAWLIALDSQGNIFKNLFPELILTNFILKGTSNSARR